MSDIEQIDFSTLIWVKKELDETFNRAQAAIEEYVENPEDENQLQFCATYLHQVQGTLKMVELYGAAMVAEEMEQVVKKILNKEVDSEKDSFEVLMRGIILLPDYLERIQLGYKDIPMVLLPLVNDLRTVKGDQLLSESALFNPDLSLGLPESNLRSSFTLSQNQLEQVVKKIRSAYQVCLLNWLKNVDVKGNLKKIQIIVDKLKTVITPVEEKQLFWVAGGLFEALINGGLEESVTVKQLAARLDQAIRMITVPKSKDDSYYRELTNNLLYYVALSDSKDRRINEIQQFFNLANFISDDKEIEHAQSSLSGKNRELLESVTSVIKEDLMTIQESLDLYNRNHETTSSDLENIIDSMRKISDTLGIIGIGVAREKVRDEIAIIEEGLKTEDKLDNDVIMHVAETLLFVESSLDENIQSLGEIKPRNTEGEENSISTTEMKNIMDTLAKESISNLQKIKHNFVQYIEEPWKKETIESSPKLLKEISGALNMSGYKDVAEQIDKIEVYTSNYMLNPDYKPTANQLNMLAESIASLEYYLEYLSDGVKGEERILELAKTNIDSLFETIELAKKHNVQPENIDADLDNMSDDDFDLEDELDDEFDLDSNDEIDYEDDLLLDTEELIQSELSESTTEESSNPSVEEMNNSDETTLESQENAELEEVDKTETELELSFMEEEKKQDLYVSFGEETDEDIKEVFLEEFEEELEHLNSIFPRWEKNPDEQMELLGEIRRIYHTLKGSGRLVGALAIGDYSWRIEDMTNLVLNDSERLNQSFILVMQKSTEILPDLYQALKDETIVPPGYYQILEAAEKVIDKQEVTSIIFDEGTSIKDEIQTTEIDTGSVENDIVNEEFDEIITLNEEIDSTSSDTTTPDDVVESDLSVDPVFIEILQQEVEGHLSEISEYINNIKETGNASSTEQFIRVVHTLNGAANMASVKSIVEMTTPLELAAKLSNELDVEFENETVEKISEFSAEASEIMKDLTSKSQSNQVTSELHDYFKNLLEELESKKHDLATKEETGSNEFDLSEFLDDVEDIQDDENIEDSEDIELDVAEASLNLISEEIEENDSIDSEDQEDNSDVSLQDEDLIDIDLEQSEEDKSIINEINEKDLKQVDQGAVTEQVSSENDGIDLDFSFDEEDLQADRSENEEKDLSSDEPEEIEISEDLVDESLDLDSEIDLEFDEDAFNNNTKETNIDVESESTDAEESTLDEVQEFEELSLDDLADGTNEDFEIELEEITLVEGVDESEEDLELELEEDIESESEEDLELELADDLESESEEDLELELEEDLESESEEDLELELEDDLESESEEDLELELEDYLESESEEGLELELELEDDLESE
ncbi:MAG: Hpt domain-containing protein, partial [Marinicellaceae bacterium]